MTEQHTPGPWLAKRSVVHRDDGSVVDFWDLHGPDHSHIAYVTEVDSRAGSLSADVRLLASAPELLEALKEQVVECFDDEPCEVCARHMALIARIEGTDHD
jgi:hypothetical protein